jgi:formate-dependent nitrite reductase membrane component NrfD
MVYYTPQKEWIKGGGIKLWLAFFFIELGAGMFFVASFFNSIWAMSIGWFVCAVLGGGLHLLFLGKPLRFWRMVLSSGWKTSWISRGLVFVMLFLGLSLVHIILTQLGSPVTGLLVAANVFAFVAIIYGGFAMNFVNGIPLWNTALIPILYVVSGLWGGAEVTLGITSVSGEIGSGVAIERWIQILLIGFILIIPAYLISVSRVSTTGAASIRDMVLGRWSLMFWVVVVMVGMVIPLVAVTSSFLVGLEATPVAFLYVAMFAGLLGDLTMRYLILSCGFYSPLLPSSSLPNKG